MCGPIFLPASKPKFTILIKVGTGFEIRHSRGLTVDRRRDEIGHRHDSPAGRAVENGVQPAKSRDSLRGHAELAETLQILVASASDEQPLLPFEKSRLTIRPNALHCAVR